MLLQGFIISFVFAICFLVRKQEPNLRALIIETFDSLFTYLIVPSFSIYYFVLVVYHDLYSGVPTEKIRGLATTLICIEIILFIVIFYIACVENRTDEEIEKSVFIAKVIYYFLILLGASTMIFDHNICCVVSGLNIPCHVAETTTSELFYYHFFNTNFNIVCLFIISIVLIFVASIICLLVIILLSFLRSIRWMYRKLANGIQTSKENYIRNVQKIGN